MDARLARGWDFDGGAGLGMEVWRISVKDEDRMSDLLPILLGKQV